MDERRLQTELDELTRRLLAMPLADQYEFAARVEQLVNLDRPLLHNEATQRKETLACLREAMAHLALERPLKKDEYERVQKELGLAWSWQRIHRLWLSFELAARAAAGGRLPLTWQDRDFQRRYGRGHGRREEPLTAVRSWLATTPATLTRRSYDDFARQHNLKLEEGGLPLPRAARLCQQLALSFREILAAASGERSVGEVVAQARAETDWSRGSDDLIGVGTIALMRGVSLYSAAAVARAPDFPRPVLTLTRCDVWLREEVQAFLDGDPLPLGEMNRLRDRYLTTNEVGHQLALAPQTMKGKGPESLQPIAQVGRMNLWLCSEVEDYARAHAADIARRLRNRVKPGLNEGKRCSRFVTLSGFAREVAMDTIQAQRVFNEPGFPPSAAWFGDAGIWLREEVEQYLLGETLLPRPANALQELLMTGHELREHLAYSSRSAYDRANLPAPVTLTNAGNIYLRADIEAHLDTDPRRREQLEARRIGREQTT